MLSRLRVRQPSASGQDRTLLLFIAGLGFLAVATGALIAMIVFVPQQNDNAVATAMNARGVNQHTAYDGLLRQNLDLNAAEDELAKAQIRMIRENVGVARKTESNARTVMQHLQGIDAHAVVAQRANEGISFEAGVIDGINQRIQASTKGILRTSRQARAGVRENNRRNAVVLADSRAIAGHQGGSAALDARVLRYVKSIQCSPLVHQCGNGGLPAKVTRPGPAKSAAAPSAGHNPARVAGRLLDAHVPAAVKSALPRPLQSRLHHPTVPPLGIGSVPVVGAVESGLAASSLVGGALSALGIRRRRLRRMPPR
ncbi:MAG TPA: hypothetical protein VFT62_11455 [Mycobacteriales bacterium]|nr:hypothetical protein [Mycobacteriales bacterium]